MDLSYSAIFAFKKYALSILAAYLLFVPAKAQKFGYVNTNFILSKMSEYTEAKAEIDKLSKGWQQEMEGMQQEIDGLYSSLKAEEVLLTPDMKQERLNLIDKKEKALKEYQNKVFGYEGLYFLKKKELMKPVQDMVYDAVAKVAHDHKLQVVFDKSGDLVMIYTNPVHDYTDYVLDELGLGDPNDVVK